MEPMLLDRIKRLGYTGELLDPDKLSEAIKLGPKSMEYTKLVSWMADELKILGDMEESIHPITCPDDTSSFLLELNCFLKELDCINDRFATGSVNERLATDEDRCYLIEVLASEVRTCRLLELKNLKGEPSMEVNINESDAAKDLKEMLITLSFEKPPDNISPEMLFARLETKLNSVLKNAAPDILNKPLITEELSKSQWDELAQLQQQLYLEYMMRRDMLLKRLDVTIQSFFWADAIKSRAAELSAKYEEARKLLNPEPQVTIADFLAARSDIAVIEKMSNATVRKNTRSKINSIIIGDVPDRGGRPYEQEPPPPEMPSWQKDRVPGPPGFGGGRGGARGGSGFRGRGRGAGFSGEGSGYQGANTSSSGISSGGWSSSGGGGPSGGTAGLSKPGGYGGFGGKGGGFSTPQGGGFGGVQGAGFSSAQGGGFGGFAATQGSGFEGFAGTQGGGFADAQGSGGLGAPGGGGNGNGVKSGGGFRNRKDTMDHDCKNIDYHQPQYSGYGHRYCYPSNAASGGSKDEQQYQRSGGNNRGRGGKVQGGWNQGGNNRGSDNYQQGGYNRSSDSYQQGGYNRGSDNYEQGSDNYQQGGYNRSSDSYQQGGYNRGSSGYKRGGQNRDSDNYQQGGSNRGSDNYQRGGYNRGSDSSQRGQNRRRGMGERNY